MCPVPCSACAGTVAPSDRIAFGGIGIGSPVRTAVADAALVCAESLDRAGALALYDTLSRLDIPKPVRMAARHSAFTAEVRER